MLAVTLPPRSLSESGEYSDSHSLGTELERSIKLREYDEGSTVLTLAEELEDSINERMEGQASFSANPDEAIAIAMQQRELAKYSKTRKKIEVFCRCRGPQFTEVCRCRGPQFTEVCGLSLLRCTGVGGLSLLRCAGVGGLSLLRCAGVGGLSLLRCAGVGGLSLQGCRAGNIGSMSTTHCM